MSSIWQDPITLGVIGGITAMLAVVVYNFRKSKQNQDKDGPRK